MPKRKYEYIKSKNLYRKRIKSVDGKYHALYGKTPKELTEKVREAEALIFEYNAMSQGMTVAELTERWLQMKEGHIAPPTMMMYRSRIKQSILLPLGDKLISQVSPEDIAVALKKEAKMSESVYHSAVMLYKGIFQFAVDNGLLDKNPAERVPKKGGIKPKGKPSLTDDQCKILLDAIREFSVYPFCMLCLYAGLRREEALGLKWDCVHLDEEAPYIEVRRTWHSINDQPYISEETKTPAGRRNIPIPTLLMKCLHDLKSTQSGKNGLLFEGKQGEPLKESEFRKMWDRVRKRSTQERHYYSYHNGKKVKHVVKPELGKAIAHNPKCIATIDFRVEPHILRHTYITNLLLKGVDVKTVQYLAGHENAKITLDIYTHLTYNQPKDLKLKIDKAFEEEH